MTSEFPIRPEKHSDAPSQAIRAMVGEHQDSLYRLAFRILGRAHDAEEARQAVFLKLVEKPNQLDAVQSVAAWLKRCVINESMLLLRKQRRIKEVALSDQSLDTRATGREMDVLHSEQVDILQAAMLELEPEVRAMLSLRFDEDLTIREIGRLLDQAHTTVQSKLDRAIRQLRLSIAKRNGAQVSYD